jgi:hypothetical protein
MVTLADLASLDLNEAGPFSPVSFSNIMGVGYYIEHEEATGPIHVHIEGFAANLTAVPEPGSLETALM